MNPLPLAMATLVALPVAAQQDPDFATCMDIALAGFERDLARSRAAGEDSFESGDVSAVEFCGTSGIVDCDRAPDPFPCQHALAAQQETLRWKVLAALPPPDAVRGMAGTESDALYPALHALAHDRSAGPDCAGQTEAMEAWCTAREASLRLKSAVLAWQMARWLGAAPDAVTAGWTRRAPPVRPVARAAGD